MIWKTREGDKVGVLRVGREWSKYDNSCVWYEHAAEEREPGPLIKLPRSRAKRKDTETCICQHTWKDWNQTVIIILCLNKHTHGSHLNTPTQTCFLLHPAPHKISTQYRDRVTVITQACNSYSLVILTCNSSPKIVCALALGLMQSLVLLCDRNTN
jgi:hypothetical protein